MESRGDGLRSSNPTLNRRGSNSSLHAGKCGSTPNLPIILSVFFSGLISLLDSAPYLMLMIS